MGGLIMDIRQLRYFLTICEEGQITAAARRLHMAQPPLSLALKNLEDELGTILIKRGNREIVLTDAGERLKEKAIQILRLCESAKTEVLSADRESKKVLTIGVVSSSHSIFLSEALHKFHTSYPKVRFELHEGSTFEVLEWLEKGIVELGVVRTPFPHKQYQMLELQQECMVCVVQHNQNPFKTTQIKLSELENHPLIYYQRYEQIYLELFVELGFTPNVVCLNQDARTTILWAKAGFGIGLVPKSAISLIDMEDLDCIDIQEERLHTKLVMIMMKERYLSDMASIFYNFYKEFICLGT